MNQDNPDRKAVVEAKALALHFKERVTENGYLAWSMVTLYNEVLRLEKIIAKQWTEAVCDIEKK